MATSLFFNPACSKCRTVSSMLDEHGVEYALVRYLDQSPSVEELTQLMVLLGIDDPREMMRTAEPVYGVLRLAGATPARLLEAISEHPILLERPIIVIGDRAIIARPPERVMEFLSPPPGTATGSP